MLAHAGVDFGRYFLAGAFVPSLRVPHVKQKQLNTVSV